MNIKKSIESGCAIKQKRKGEMAKSIGKAPQTVSEWCGGKSQPSLASVCDMAEFFGVKVSIFISWGEKE